MDSKCLTLIDIDVRRERNKKKRILQYSISLLHVRETLFANRCGTDSNLIMEEEEEEEEKLRIKEK